MQNSQNLIKQKTNFSGISLFILGISFLFFIFAVASRVATYAHILVCMHLYTTYIYNTIVDV